MGQYKTVLLASFTNNDYLDSSVRRIFKTFKIENDKLFIFSDEDNRTKKIVTYNVLVPANQSVDIKKVLNTIRINRKKETNTLYTINSLNRIIEKETGRLDENYRVDWANYQNCLLVSDKNNGSDVLIVKTMLYNIIDKDTFFQNNTAENKGSNPQYIY